MPNSIARRARLESPFYITSVIAVSAALLGPTWATAADPTADNPASGTSIAVPPLLITVPFSERDSFAGRLQSYGVERNEARDVEAAIRTVLSPGQRREGALVQVSFVDTASSRALDLVRIEPLSGSPIIVARSSLAQLPPAVLPAAKPVAAKPASQHAATNIARAAAADDGDPEWPAPARKSSASVNVAGDQTALVFATARGVVGTSVERSLANAGVPRNVAHEIAVAATIYPPLKGATLAGSRFDVAYEPGPDAPGGFALASFTVNGVEQRLWRYRPANGMPGYYSDDGARIGGLALQSPVRGARIVSPFGMRRHPVLHVNKMHWGVDYEANTGTPILAAADGIVEDVRRLGNYGLYIRLSHRDGVETTYGHLSRFAQGIKRGDAVKAGDTIGYAGRSGLASGPHLYFEVVANGKRVDPAPLVSEAPLRLIGPELASFQRFKEQASAIETAAWRQE